VIALAVAALVAALVAVPAGAARDPSALVLQLEDLSTVFDRTGARYRTNATTARENGVKPALLESWGRINGYEALYERDVDPAVPPRGAATITANVSVYRSAAGLRKAYARSVARIGEVRKGEPARVARALPGRVGDVARLWETRITEDGLPIVVYTLVWRANGVLSHLSVAGIQGRLRPADVLALARKQQARVDGTAKTPGGPSA
jgi:hypothetical protein